LLVFLLGALLVLRLNARRNKRTNKSMNGQRSAPARWPLFAKRPLATPGQVLYQRLVVALPGHTILSRVSLGEVLVVKRGFDAAPWSKRLRLLEFDFVVCASEGTVLAAIELDGLSGSDSASGRARALQIKAHAAASASVRLLHWQANALPDQAAIQEIFGLAPSPYAEGVDASANQSWWPPISSARHKPPPV